MENQNIKQHGIGNVNPIKMPSTNATSLDEMISNLAMLGFDKANTILLPDYKTQNTLEYGSMFNSIITGILNIKSGIANLGSLAELEKKVYNLYSEVNNNTFFGDLTYGSESIGYNLFFPKVAEFLKTEINKLRQENSAYTGFQDNLRKIGAIGTKGSIGFIGCSDLANFALSDYHRVVEEIIRFSTSHEMVDLNKIYSEEIPQLQELVIKNKHKILGEVIYNGKFGEVSGFLYSFGEYLKNKIKYLDRDVGERDKIELVEEEKVVYKKVNLEEKKEKTKSKGVQMPDPSTDKRMWFYEP